MKRKTGKNWKAAAFASAAALLHPSPGYPAAKVTSIDFKTEGGNSYVEIRSDQPITYEKTEHPQDRQIVLDLKDASLAKSASRKLDTSSFQSRVSLVSPYQPDAKVDASRVVIQLREPAGADVTQDGNLIRIAIQNAPGSAASASTPASAPAPASTEPIADASALTATVSSDEADPAASGPAPADASKGRNEIKSLDDFIDARKSHRFIGKPISLQVRDMDLVDFFQLIGESSGFNVVIGPEVQAQGKITLSLSEVPWDQALELVLSTKQLGAEKRHNVLRITTLKALTEEKQAELSAKKASEQAAPRITRIFPISYAKLTDLVATFQKFATAVGNGDSASSMVQPDERTNSLIIRDTSENVERMRKLVEVLDTQTPQVLIEAKIIEATESNGSEIMGGIGAGGYTAGVAGSSAGNMVGGAFNGAQINTDTSTSSLLSTVVTQSAAGGAFGIAPQLSFLPGPGRLNAIIALNEREEKVKVISSPRTVVLNKETASIVAGQPVLVVTTATGENGPYNLSTVQSANLSLNVKPSVTNDGGVLMDVSIQRAVPRNLGASGAIADRTMTTKVLVESGTTLVIGGIYSSESSKTESGFPLLRKLPIIGHFFGNESERTERTELFIFITPRILNEKEAGLAST